MTQLSAPSKSKSLSVDLKKASRYFILAQPIIVLVIAGLAGFGIYQIYNIFQTASDVSSVANENYSNYFDQDAIKKLREVSKKRSAVGLPEGRTNPLK